MPVGSARQGLNDALDEYLIAGAIEPGFYRVQLVPRAAWSPVRIWRGFGWEPETYHFREVHWGYRAFLNGVTVPIRRVWPNCAWERVSRQEYRYMVDLHRYAVEHENHLPEASPYQPVDWDQMKFDFAAAKAKK